MVFTVQLVLHTVATEIHSQFADIAMEDINQNISYLMATKWGGAFYGCTIHILNIFLFCYQQTTLQSFMVIAVSTNIAQSNNFVIVAVVVGVVGQLENISLQFLCVKKYHRTNEYIEAISIGQSFLP